jgi:hypothetical protein
MTEEDKQKLNDILSELRHIRARMQKISDAESDVAADSERAILSSELLPAQLASSVRNMRCSLRAYRDLESACEGFEPILAVLRKYV